MLVKNNEMLVTRVYQMSRFINKNTEFSKNLFTEDTHI